MKSGLAIHRQRRTVGSTRFIMEDRTKARKGDQSASWTVCPCNNCSGNLEFDSAHAGETVNCPHCGMDTVLFMPQVPTGPPHVRVAVVAVVASMVILCAILIWQHHSNRDQAAKYAHLPLGVLQEKASKGDPKAQCA